MSCDAIKEHVHGLFLVKRQGASGAAGTLTWSLCMGYSRGSGGGSIARRRLSVTITLMYAGRTSHGKTVDWQGVEYDGVSRGERLGREWHAPVCVDG